MKYTAATRRAAIQRTAEGEETSAISASLGVPESTIRRWVQQATTVMPLGARLAAKKAGLRAEVRTLRRSGMSYDAIEAATGCPKTTSAFWCADLPTPKRKKRNIYPRESRMRVIELRVEKKMQKREIARVTGVTEKTVLKWLREEEIEE